jgi:hypothetical protein
MSLIQDALDKAHEKEPEIEKLVIPVAEEPRMQNIQFYETSEIKETAPASAFRPKKKKSSAAGPAFQMPSFQISPNIRLAIIIGSLVIVTLLIGRNFIPMTTTSETAAAMPSQAVVVKTQTPITQKTTSQIKFTLTGITETEGVKLALINNQVVGEGDKLRENAVVKSISNENVVVEYQNKPVTLSL